MTPMLEKCARALAIARTSESYIKDRPDRAKALIDTNVYLVRAVLQTLMEPDEGMLKAAQAASGIEDSDVVRVRTARLFRAMISSILAGDEEKA